MCAKKVVQFHLEDVTKSICPDQSELRSHHLRAHTCARCAQTTWFGKAVKPIIVWKIFRILSNQWRFERALVWSEKLLSAVFEYLLLFYLEILGLSIDNNAAVFWFGTHLVSDCADQNQRVQLNEIAVLIYSLRITVDRNFFHWKLSKIIYWFRHKH